MTETQSSQDVSTKLERIAKLARDKPGVSLLTLAHHIDVDWLREAYRRTRKDGARGVDGQGAVQYAEQREANLQSLRVVMQRTAKDRFSRALRRLRAWCRWHLRAAAMERDGRRSHASATSARGWSA